ncbi:putative alpha-glucosidase [Rhodovastum atsumiense]|uniref:Alpha-glucosidase n=1 Tax=Rhodovastum atsumiense TaxID=504468 RepID=A0A5M6IXW2_9PROT|nr:alpha-glucosidase [Rhodovastum atsumiense]KAA5613183.1 alpha-glucosidase [Rhodovastum atsumiense]CAH2600665.1 putative alpha-glucosidase [Rhodovastum atsumiense]
MDWWRGAVIYQIYPRSYFDSNNDGIGDLPGITARLDHVARLGVDAIWLCPFFTSPQKDFGYDVSDHLAVDPIFGTMADFDTLLARAHALGLKVLIDQVWSHTSDRHGWFLESRASRDNPRADWYVWADPSPDGTPPNNWLSVFGGSAWTWEPRRRQYYLHHFLTHQPALNLHSPAVVDAILEGGRFWLARGVDGFRLDAIDFLMHDPALRSNPAAPRPPGPLPAKIFGLQQHLHDMLQPQAMGVLARIRALTDQFPGATTLGEVSSQDGALARLQRYTAGSEHLHMAYTLRPLRHGFDWPTVRTLIQDIGAMRDGWPCWSFSNHDVERAVTRWHPRGRAGENDTDFARLLMAFLLCLRGSVSVYQGEELALPEAELAFEDMRDPFGIAFWPEFRGRDGSRTPMPWTASADHAGFTTARPWLPVPASHRARAVDTQETPTSVLAGWRRFLAWRRTRPALRWGSLTPVELPEPLVGFLREDQDERILCLFNLSETPVQVDLEGYPSFHVLAESGFAPKVGPGTALLPRFGVLLVQLQPGLAPVEATALPELR